MKLTQDQIAWRYNIDQGTVSAVLRRYDVPISGRVVNEDTHHVKRLYEEKDAVYALKQYYRDRADGYRQKARGFDDKAEWFVAEFERNYLKDRLIV